jgi:hypothetical protein
VGKGVLGVLQSPLWGIASDEVTGGLGLLLA